MKVKKPGHIYMVQSFENEESFQTINFIDKEPKEEGSTEMVTIKDGTTNEELIEVLVDRIAFLNGKFPCRENSLAITKLQEAMFWLNKKTDDRKKRGVEGKHEK